MKCVIVYAFNGSWFLLSYFIMADVVIVIISMQTLCLKSYGDNINAIDSCSFARIENGWIGLLSLYLTQIFLKNTTYVQFRCHDHLVYVTRYNQLKDCLQLTFLNLIFVLFDWNIRYINGNSWKIFFLCVLN